MFIISCFCCQETRGVLPGLCIKASHRLESGFQCRLGSPLWDPMGQGKVCFQTHPCGCCEDHTPLQVVGCRNPQHLTGCGLEAARSPLPWGLSAAAGFPRMSRQQELGREREEDSSTSLLEARHGSASCHFAVCYCEASHWVRKCPQGTTSSRHGNPRGSPEKSAQWVQ